MVSFRAVVIFTLTICIGILSGCVGGEKAGSNSNATVTDQKVTNQARTNVEELGVLVNIPYETEDIVWKDDATNKKLTAVLRFSPTDSGRLVTEAEKIRPPQQVNLSSESWFPPELIAQSDLSGDDTLNGVSYAATMFLQEPYVSGSITRIENTDYFVLEASAK